MTFDFFRGPVTCGILAAFAVSRGRFWRFRGTHVFRTFRHGHFANALTVFAARFVRKASFPSGASVKPGRGRLHPCHRGGKGIRTPDPLLAGQVLSQLSYTPKNLAAACSPMPSPA